MKNFAKHQMIKGLAVTHSLPVTSPGHCVTRSVGMTLRKMISSSIPRFAAPTRTKHILSLNNSKLHHMVISTWSQLMVMIYS